MRQVESRNAEFVTKDINTDFKALKIVPGCLRCSVLRHASSFPARSKGSTSASSSMCPSLLTFRAPKVSGMANVTGIAIACRKMPRVKGNQGFLAISQAARGGPMRKQR